MMFYPWENGVCTLLVFWSAAAPFSSPSFHTCAPHTYGVWGGFTISTMAKVRSPVERLFGCRGKARDEQVDEPVPAGSWISSLTYSSASETQDASAA